MRVGEALVKYARFLKNRPAAADEDRGMADWTRASSSSTPSTCAQGRLGRRDHGGRRRDRGRRPRHGSGPLSHSVISPGANYFAVLLGAIAGGFPGARWARSGPPAIASRRRLHFTRQKRRAESLPSLRGALLQLPMQLCPGRPRLPSRRPSGLRRHRSRRRRSHPCFSRRHPRLRRSSPRHPFRLRAGDRPGSCARGTHTHARTRCGAGADARAAHHSRAGFAAARAARDGACSREALRRTRAPADAGHPESPAARRVGARNAAALLLRQLATP